MSRNERDTPEAHRSRRGRFDLFYYEREGEGDRYYLRFTRFALALFIIFPLLVILLLLVFFLSGSDQPIRDIDVTIKPPPAETPRPSLSPTPQPRTAPTVRRGPSPANTHAAPTPSPGGNTNE